jgi:hypothetical protein
MRNLRARLARLEATLPDPLPEPEPLSSEEVLEGIEQFIHKATYNPAGVFDDDPEFRHAWTRYHRLWELHTGGYLGPLDAVWLRRTPEKFEEARQQVVGVMLRVLEHSHKKPLRVLGEVLAHLAA